jgi:hypothetical protein
MNADGQYRKRYHFVRSVVILLGLLTCTILLPNISSATHFRGGTMSATINAGGVVTITAETRWRKGGEPDEIFPLSGIVRPNVGNNSNPLPEFDVLDGTTRAILRTSRTTSSGFNSALQIDMSGTTTAIDSSDPQFDIRRQVFTVDLPGLGLGTGHYILYWVDGDWVDAVANLSYPAHFSLECAIIYDGSPHSTPQITAPIPHLVTKGLEYKENLGATGSSALSYSFIVGSADPFFGPSSQIPGITLNNSGQVDIPASSTSTLRDINPAGQPGADYVFDVRITDADGESVEEDVLLDVITPNDVQAIAITEPDPNGVVENVPAIPVVIVQNNTPFATESYPVRLRIRQLPAQNIVYEQFVSNSQGPYGTSTDTFPSWNPTPGGTYRLIAVTLRPGDLNSGNDAFSREQIVVPAGDIVSISPGGQCYDFETGAQGWFGAGDFVLATPAKTQLNAAHSGTNAWITKTVGNYTDFWVSAVYSPIFDLSALQDVYLSFFHNIQTEPSWDASIMEYTTDNGVTWLQLGSLNDPHGLNWYNESVYQNAAGSPTCFDFNAANVFRFLGGATGPKWTSNGDCGGVDSPTGPGRYYFAQRQVSSEVGGKPHVRFRYRTFADAGGNYEGWAFDDFCITDQPKNTVSGRVTASCPAAGTGMDGVRVDAYSAGTGDLVQTTVTDPQGNYRLTNLPAGNYTITIVTPLGYTATSEEIVATVTDGGRTTVNFSLNCITIVANTRSIGFWKHEVGVATGDKGSSQFSSSALCGFLNLINEHFNNNLINQVVVYQPPSSGQCSDKLQVAKNLLNLVGSQAMIARARQQLMALLLNIAAGFTSQTQKISVDGASVSQAVTYSDHILDSTNGNFENAKTICDLINNMQTVAAGVIPLTTINIGYKAGRNNQIELPDKFALGQNYPNPFNPTTVIQYALPHDAFVTLKVYNTLGDEVLTLVNREQTAGYRSVTFNAATLPSGIYIYRFVAGGFSDVKRMLLVK